VENKEGPPGDSKQEVDEAERLAVGARDIAVGTPT
jgi:hypothetical protein